MTGTAAKATIDTPKRALNLLPAKASGLSSFALRLHCICFFVALCVGQQILVDSSDVAGRLGYLCMRIYPRGSGF